MTRYRCRCWRSGVLPGPPPVESISGRVWRGWYRTTRPRVLLGAVLVEADAPDDAHQAAQAAYPGADFIEVEPLGPPLLPAA